MDLPPDLPARRFTVPVDGLRKAVNAVSSGPAPRSGRTGSGQFSPARGALSRPDQGSNLTARGLRPTMCQASSSPAFFQVRVIPNGTM